MDASSRRGGDDHGHGNGYTLTAVVSSSARSRLGAARTFAERFPGDREILIVAATRGAADDFARGIASARAAFGLHRFSLTELAARAASVSMTAAGRVPGTYANAEAVAARATFEALDANELEYFGPVARTPGFPRAVARTVHELRLSLVEPSALGSQASSRDLATLAARIDGQLQEARVDDRAAMFTAASAAWAATRWAAYPVLLLDVPLTAVAERQFVLALFRGADVLVTIPAGDEPTRRALSDIVERGANMEELDDDAPVDSDIGRLRRHIFTLDPPPERSLAGDVRFFSAPGEAREAIEIARRVLDEAGRGIRFDDMAVCLRSPQQYLGLLEHAFERAGVPAYFERGTRRPDPSGRAFVALLSCACESLSAKRFDEYLSLGEVPLLPLLNVESSIPSVPDDEMYARFELAPGEDDPDEWLAKPPAADSDDDAIVAGALRAPWKWEELIVESAVIGGVDRAQGKGRWRRRLDGLAAEFHVQLSELCREEPESPRIARLTRDLRNLRHLRAFALPIIDTLGDWPAAATWGEWLDAFSALAPRALRRPERVLRVLADLRPMAAIGPVNLDEARDLLQSRLLTLEWDPPSRRYGRVFVGTPHQVRGRAFSVVFVPGLAERVFPQRVREDPLLPDATRRDATDSLVTSADRTAAERLLLRLAIGAATTRLYLSYPRLGAEMGDMRPRVPSFYALDVMRAMTGRVPDHRTLAANAADEGDASLAWPAPRDPSRAIDDLEHDLAVLAPLMDSRDPAGVKGHARYLLELNPALRRSIISRWARWHGRWSTSDGIIQVTPATAPALTRHRLTNRPYSLSALQRFATCPYQFFLAAIHRIEVWHEPEPLVRLDPLTRGSLFHRAQTECLRALQTAGALPVTAAGLPAAVQTLHGAVERVAKEYEDLLAPAIARVWNDEIQEIRRDLGIWLNRMAETRDWIPEFFEFSFGLDDSGRDPRSLPDPVPLNAGFLLRGSVDLIERSPDASRLRVTDHKTGKYRATDDLIIGGGKTLQPVLYSMVIEHGLGKPVEEGRLYFCTTAGGFRARAIRIDDYARSQGQLALTMVDRAIELGHLPAAPDKDACRWCDFRPVCGPGEEERIARKPRALLGDLFALREVR